MKKYLGNSPFEKVLAFLGIVLWLGIISSLALVVPAGIVIYAFLHL